MFPLSKLQEEGIMKNNKLTIKVYMNVLEVHQGKPTVDCYGFPVLASQGLAVSQIFVEHPDIINDKDFRPKNQSKSCMVHCMTVLLETLKVPPECLSDTDLSNADRKLSELTEVGFKLDWLVTKLEDAKEINSRAQVLDQLKNIELTLSSKTKWRR